MNKPIIKILAISVSIFFITSAAFSQEEIEYKKFKLENSSCDVGVRYKNTPKGIVVGVSAIATGKGDEFRKWKVSEIKLKLGGERYKPDKEGKFYVTEESLFRVPGAIVFAAIGALSDYGGSGLEEGISKTGAAIGFGLIALQANGEITGECCIFNVPAATVDKIEEGKDSIEILIENEDQHLKDIIKIGLIKPTGEMAKKFDYDKMNQGDLLSLVDDLKGRIVSLEKEQSEYKYGQDPEYDDIQRKIEKLETERGMAYKIWFERRQE